MDMPKLQLQTQQAKLILNTNPARHEYHQQKAEQSIQQPKADVKIEQKPGRLTIDQSNAWRNLHFKSVFERTREVADDANQKWLEGIGRMAEEGDDLMRVENGGNPVAEHAKNKSVMNFTYLPGNTPTYDLVKARYEANPAVIEVQRNDPIIETTPRYPQFEYQRGSVDVSLAQHADVKIDWKI
ncbi:DUF6470 family protein [Halobacillus yeomjeoni]|uniref:Uncharacterized protein n=1 Tax=Halobacillus yeomjeoni TaxID=311194 RepID=A0A931MVZ1_9BACI|nr:DUF6470 family protein [Halobacillus yeomjeoni]MBH0230881.1 hypothetical protein [Halobacillus yeomjeoni]